MVGNTLTDSMKAHLTVDMEGIAGIAHEDQTEAKDADFARARKLMTDEVRAAIEGAKAGGAKEVVVCDAHDTGRNILFEELDSDVVVIEGTPYDLGMMAGISEEFDASFQIGYHAMRDTHAGTIGHTYTYAFAKLRLNGVLLGESGLSAAIAGHFGVPVVMVSGDLHAVKQAQALMPKIVGVPTKEGIGLYGVKTLNPRKACEDIRSGAEEAMRRVGEMKPYVVDAPVTMEVDFTRTIMAQRCAQMPMVERTDDKSVKYQAKDVVDAFRVFDAMSMICSAARGEGLL
ncbi:MAG: M55 family metallopeptidase [Methanobacteriota archaeon]|nr:MAG: M55 family metallopeptidase [Euryarchaeota archaeon]